MCIQRAVTYLCKTAWRPNIPSACYRPVAHFLYRERSSLQQETIHASQDAKHKCIVDGFTSANHRILSKKSFHYCLSQLQHSGISTLNSWLNSVRRNDVLYNTSLSNWVHEILSNKLPKKNGGFFQTNTIFFWKNRQLQATLKPAKGNTRFKNLQWVRGDKLSNAGREAHSY